MQDSLIVLINIRKNYLHFVFNLFISFCFVFALLWYMNPEASAIKSQQSTHTQILRALDNLWLYYFFLNSVYWSTLQSETHFTWNKFIFHFILKKTNHIILPRESVLKRAILPFSLSPLMNRIPVIFDTNMKSKAFCRRKKAKCLSITLQKWYDAGLTLRLAFQGFSRCKGYSKEVPISLSIQEPRSAPMFGFNNTPIFDSWSSTLLRPSTTAQVFQ